MSLDAGAHDLRPEGKISHCDGCIAECRYFCCDFDQDPASGNFMVMYPGEFERSAALGWDMSNIELLATDADGGVRFTTPHRLCCQIPALDANAASGGDTPSLGLYKSFECRVYPLWPYLHNNEWRFRISERCPIHKRDLNLEEKVDEIRAELSLLVTDLRVKRWFQHQRCAGKYKEYPTRYDMPREAVILPPDVTRSSIVYLTTVNGRVLRYGLRAASGTIQSSQVEVLSDLILACVVADMADCEYIDVYRPVTAALLEQLRVVALDASAETRQQAGAPIPIVRASSVVAGTSDERNVSDPLPALEIICDHASMDGHRVNSHASANARPGAEALLRMAIRLHNFPAASSDEWTQRFQLHLAKIASHS